MDWFTKTSWILKYIILFILFIVSCKTAKIDNQSKDNSLTELVSAILSEVTRRDRDNICLIEKSVSFDFRFPDSINEETDGLTEEEKRSIESEFSRGSIKWSEVLGKSFQTKGKNCIAISKPVLFRNGKRRSSTHHLVLSSSGAYPIIGEQL